MLTVVTPDVDQLNVEDWPADMEDGVAVNDDITGKLGAASHLPLLQLPGQLYKLLEYDGDVAA